MRMRAVSSETSGAWAGLVAVALAAVSMVAGEAWAQPGPFEPMPLEPPPREAERLADAAQVEPRVLADFEGEASWLPSAAPGIEPSVKVVEREGSGRALRIEYDFTGAAGFVVATLPMSIEMPGSYELSYELRGGGAPGNLEVKLLGPDDGATVWWHLTKGVAWPEAWTRLTSRSRQFRYAWGPIFNTPFERISGIEFAVSAAEAGKGFIEIDNVVLREVAKASTYDGGGVMKVSRGRLVRIGRDVSWTLTPQDRGATLTLDLRGPVEFNAVELGWSGVGHPGNARVLVSENGVDWTPVSTLWKSAGGVNTLFTPGVVARQVRIEVSPRRDVTLNKLDLIGPDTVADRSDYGHWLAKRLPRGMMPRHMLHEGHFWTAVGVPAGLNEVLLSEDGAIELGVEAPTIEPFIVLEASGASPRRVISWADATTTHALAEGYIPVPTVTWTGVPVELSVTVAASGVAGSDEAAVRYRLTNTSGVAQRGELVLAARPVQVMPSWQRVATEGGLSSVLWAEPGVGGFTLRMPKDRVMSVGTLTQPSRWGGTAWSRGTVPMMLAAGDFPSQATGEDPEGFSEAALAYAFDLAPGASTDVHIQVPLSPGVVVQRPYNKAAEWFEQKAASAVEAWRPLLNRVTLEGPPEAQRLFDSVRSQLAYILINADGPRLQPGSRSYQRSWMRDGSLTGTALIYLGHADAAASFARWYAPYQRADGYVPCIVDSRGPDAIHEHDSHGQFISLLANIGLLTGDTTVAEGFYDNASRAVGAIARLRAERMTEAYASGDRRAYHGVLPESISHEGYSPARHSYWDNFFALKGIKDAAWMADMLGKPDDAARFRTLLGEYRGTLAESITLAMGQRGVDFVPGCAELGDFDPTSTAIGLYPAEELLVLAPMLPAGTVERTFERWYEFFRARIDGREKWHRYTPYEIRTVTAMIRLGRPDRAMEMMAWYFDHQRPTGWNHWAEVVYSTERQAEYIGDMPHTWVGSDYVSAVRHMLCYEDNERLVLMASTPASWYSGEGLLVEHMPTRFGPVNLRARVAEGAPSGPGSGRRPGGGGHVFELMSDWRRAPESITLFLPLGVKPDEVRVDGQPVAVDTSSPHHASVQLPTDRARVRVEW